MKKWLGMWTVMVVSGASAQVEYPFCQILDRVEDPAWEAHLSYVLPADLPDNGDSLGFTGLYGGGGIGYYRAPAGDIDVTGVYDLEWVNGGGDTDLPDLLGTLAIQAAFIVRTAEGQGLRLSAEPGIYSDMHEITWQSLYVPLAVEAIQTFTPTLSGMIGAGVYPGFDQVIEPRAGLRWAVMDELLIDLMYPESRITMFPAEGWEMYAGVKSSQVQEWSLDDERDSVMLDEFRGYLGVSHPLGEKLRMMYQAGMAFNRELEFGSVAPEIDVKDAVFVNVGIGGAL